jgi:endonuclease V-like protein UPF0215 family
VSELERSKVDPEIAKQYGVLDDLLFSYGEIILLQSVSFGGFDNWVDSKKDGIA